VTDPVRLLLIDDSPTDAKLITQELRRNGRSVEVELV
jgi:hypothetical protein